MNEKNEKIELLRARTRALAFLIPLTTLCAGLFVITSIQDTLVGAVVTLATGASVFYFKKEE